MSKIVSNTDIIKMFQDIDEFKAKSNLSEKKLRSEIIKRQDKIINK